MIDGSGEGGDGFRLDGVEHAGEIGEAAGFGDVVALAVIGDQGGIGIEDGLDLDIRPPRGVVQKSGNVPVHQPRDGYPQRGGLGGAEDGNRQQPGESHTGQASRIARACVFSGAGVARAALAIMSEKTYTSADVAWISGARGLAGAGFGLLLAERLGRGQRKGAGWALLMAGALMSIPMFVDLCKKPKESELHTVLVA